MLVMMSTRIGFLVSPLLAIILTGCAMADDGGDPYDQEWITAIIVGSAESPDPVLVWVKQLEREGRVRDVIVMESFPVQIRLTAPQHIIDELKATRRKLPPDPL
jgi:ACR3 family arsenite efflux pump ArsB